MLVMTTQSLNVDDWFKYVPKENCLPYLLDELGFDVWLGNNRGVYDYSANEFYRANQLDVYWNFDYTEMAEYDLPALTQYILDTTHQERLSYIGYGRGNTQMFYAMAKAPDYYEERVDKFIALAPAF